MPYRLKRKCNQFGCKTLTTQSYCSKHEKPRRSWTQPNKRRDRTPEGKKIYDEQWRKLRNAFLAEPDNALCKECYIRGVITEATDVDHVIPIVERPDLKYDADNLQPLCKSCHSRKTCYEFNTKKKESKRKPLVVIDPDD